MNDCSAVLEFWFGTDTDDALVAKNRASIWWGKNQQTDDDIERWFGSLVLAARDGELAHWEESASCLLALIILTDQFPRNIYRGTPDSFAFDTIALDLCLRGLKQGVDRELRPIQRVFFYLPLEHSEELENQVRSVELFRKLAGEVETRLKSTFDAYLDYALRHHAIIERFGRFPHRNEILGRQSTPEEAEFLKQPGSSF